MPEDIIKSLRIKTPPKLEPISRSQAKLHLRVDDDFDDDDDLIDVLISAARMSAEDFQARAFITQTWTLTRDRFPGAFNSEHPGARDTYGEYRVMRIPRPPLQQISSIKYIGRTDALDTTMDIAFDAPSRLHTMDPQYYRVDAASEPGRVAPIPAIFWPYTELSLLSSAMASVQIEFIAGYGDTAVSVPPRTIAGMLLAIGHLYENRQSIVVSGSRAIALEVPQGLKDLYWGDRMVEFA